MGRVSQVLVTGDFHSTVTGPGWGVTPPEAPSPASGPPSHRWERDTFPRGLSLCCSPCVTGGWVYVSMEPTGGHGAERRRGTSGRSPACTDQGTEAGGLLTGHESRAGLGGPGDSSRGQPYRQDAVGAQAAYLKALGSP